MVADWSWTALDILLLVALIAVVPARALWHSLFAQAATPSSGWSKYRVPILEPLALLTLLVATWVIERRPFALLGLDWPVSFAGMIGIAVTIAIVSALALAILLQAPASKSAAIEAGMKILPRSRRELPPFILFSAAVGVSWEMLYRGYLIWALSASVGTIGAVVVSGTAYALAHGYSSARSLAGSFLAAIAFGSAYATTESLWWLMTLHTGLPLVGAFAVQVASRSQNGNKSS